MLLECGGELLLDQPKTLCKNKIFIFDFPKVHNELGKVTKFGTSRPLFIREIWTFEKSTGWFSPPRPNRVNCFRSKTRDYNIMKFKTTRIYSWKKGIIKMFCFVKIISFLLLSLSCFNVWMHHVEIESAFWNIVGLLV